MRMVVPELNSVKKIEIRYGTGEMPVLVMCSDLNAYICKYKRSLNAAYKLICELIGAQMAKAWQLETPEIAFVNIKSEHSNGLVPKYGLLAPALGSKRLDGVVDINSSTYNDVYTTTSLLRQLMKIALFDFWIANEDRNVNNANLLFDVRRGRLISIDYGCVLNNADFEGSISHLTSNESILCSDLFQHVSTGKGVSVIESLINELSALYDACLKRSKRHNKELLEIVPKEWGVPQTNIEKKISQLFDNRWCCEVWNLFVESVKDNISY